MNRFRALYALLPVLILGLIAFPAAAQTAKPLPETYVSEDERLTLRYPTGWIVDNDQQGTVLVATHEDLFDLNDDPVPSGEAAVGIIFLNPGGETFPTELLDGDDPLSILNRIVGDIFTSDDETELSPPETMFFADHPAARTDGSVAGNPVFLILVDNGDKNYSLIVGIAAPGELAKVEPKLLAIAESAHYLPPPNE